MTKPMQNGGLAINLTHDAEDKEWRLWSGVFLRSPRNESLKIKRKKKERDGAPGLNPSRYSTQYENHTARRCDKPERSCAGV